MGFSKNEEGMLVRGEQESDEEEEEEEEEDEEQDTMNVDKEVSEEESEEETFRREMRQKKRQERVEEGQSCRGMSQLMEMIASMQASMNIYFDALDGKISDIQERVMRTKDAQRSLKENLQRSKRSQKTTRFCEDEVIKLKIVKTRRMFRDSFISSLEEIIFEKLSLKNQVLLIKL
ncbi:hypothetical protein M9H77_01982 [Catharanthus roseus]|uniref:Uncharacterized protein n=1 Tax=Catharanthus roseus TaxID=4058 RepID=A0ACC0C795_CATRO|nr:hypothetical protein M9H77_01982 [Catharanthus roseus]